MKYPEVRNYVGGRFVAGGHDFLDVYNPSDGEVISRVPLSSREEVDAAVASAKAAFPAGPPSRSRSASRSSIDTGPFSSATSRS
jgi:acyl-CoA reductase-like NAD-dependent aldehyde dehydrogenase